MNAILDRLPRFTITGTVSADGVIKWIGNFSVSTNVPNGYVYLYAEHDIFIKGKMAIEKATMEATFRISDLAKKDHLKIGASYPCFDGYWGDRAELVLDESRAWKRAKFEPRDTVKIHPDGTREPSPGGWDHEHCAVCWEKISHFGDYDHYGYSDQDDQWVCERCYATYIVPRNLDFITD